MRYEFATVEDLPPDFWRWPHVDPAREWACRGTGAIVVVEEFLDRLERLRAGFGRPLIITSGYRSPGHNARVSTTGRTGPHTTARAVDIGIYGGDALELVQLGYDLGFTGIGINQRGAVSSRFVHLDDLPGDGQTPRPWIWSY